MPTSSSPRPQVPITAQYTTPSRRLCYYFYTSFSPPLKHEIKQWPKRYFGPPPATIDSSLLSNVRNILPPKSFLLSHFMYYCLTSSQSHGRLSEGRKTSPAGYQSFPQRHRSDSVSQTCPWAAPPQGTNQTLSSSQRWREVAYNKAGGSVGG